MRPCTRREFFKYGANAGLLLAVPKLLTGCGTQPVLQPSVQSCHVRMGCTVRFGPVDVCDDRVDVLDGDVLEGHIDFPELPLDEVLVSEEEARDADQTDEMGTVAVEFVKRLPGRLRLPDVCEPGREDLTEWGNLIQQTPKVMQ